MNKNIIDFLIICMCAIFGYALIHGVIVMNDQAMSSTQASSPYYTCGNNADYVYFVYNDTAHLIIPTNTTHTCSYVWNGSAWIIKDVEFGLPDEYVADELYVPELTWRNITEERQK